MVSRRKNKNRSPSPMDDLGEVGPAGSRGQGNVRSEPTFEFPGGLSDGDRREDHAASAEEDLFARRGFEGGAPRDEPPFSENRAYDTIEPAELSEHDIDDANAYVSDAEFHSENGRGSVVILPPVERRLRDDGPPFGSTERRASRRVMEEPIIDAKPVRRSGRLAGRIVVVAVFLMAIAVPFVILKLPGMRGVEQNEAPVEQAALNAAGTETAPARVIDLAGQSASDASAPAGQLEEENADSMSQPPDAQTAAAEVPEAPATAMEEAPASATENVAEADIAEAGLAMAEMSSSLENVEAALGRLDGELGAQLTDLTAQLERLQSDQAAMAGRLEEIAGRQQEALREQETRIAELSRRIEDMESAAYQPLPGEEPPVTAAIAPPEAPLDAPVPETLPAPSRLPEVITGPELGGRADAGERSVPEIPPAVQAMAPAMPSPRPPNLNTAPAISRPSLARMPVLPGWVVRDVFNGRAFIQGRWGMIEVERGSIIPGGIEVLDIRPQGRNWVVLTDRGIIRAQPYRQ